ncbi:GNAT family N-acetyltransferase [Paenibacillus radicis (ex Xue et al. 2023)]|uniref:GNAT family N-acetyltransferase n=1 Tax=Paenibacillus radicis (ex Xue et al. 2023) TaxID=2972489 RepID=A0ABT1YPR7_9BACL|nr:GNAT family N-acetyltransferase [Paenibacillus radicis (ex Xue et al. 2023)]MCR8634258.1 GNAT family N-acetyltransferase [Paenibacillus radicis (ex Xue et al. 2023)]
MSTAIHVLVRDARLEEWEEAIDLTIAAYRQYEESFGQPLWEQYIKNIRSQWVNQENTQRIVAVQGGKLVGSVLLYPPQKGLYEKLNEMIPYPEVRLLGVHPSIRGKGIATTLIRECAQRAIGAGAPYLGLHTSDRMPSAVRLYTRLGFERVPEFDFFGGDNRTLVKAYRLKLAATSSL